MPFLRYFRATPLLLSLLGLTIICVCGCSTLSPVTAEPSSAPKENSKVVIPGLGAPAVPVTLAENGVNKFPIIIAADASETTNKSAELLATYVEKITGAKPNIEKRSGSFGKETAGIVVSLFTQTKEFQQSISLHDPTRTEDYLLRSHKNGLFIMGATELALQHAVWDLLYRLGYRQFFPGAKWEIIPKSPTLELSVNAFEHPAYFSRRISIGYGSLPGNAKKFDEWRERNRVASGISLSTSHAYGRIMLRNKAAFEAHPEYMALVKGKRQSSLSSKFCISNSGLRDLVVADSLRQFEKNPKLESVSLEPSDGGGWCECEECARMGSVSDRVVLLANQVAVAVNTKYPGKYVGIYAYSQHAPPPTINLHPMVVPSIATAFIQGGYSLEQLLQGWNAKSQLLGIRDYYGVFPWDRDLPGQAKGGNLNYLRTSLPRFHANGARFFATETSDSWGPLGLGHYIAARLLWNPTESGQVDALVSDFLQKAFGPAQEPMREWYQLIDGSSKPLVSTDLIGRLYRQLDSALKATSDAEIRSRIEDLILYTRYVELYSKMTQASGADRQAAFEAVMRFAHRISNTEMIHTKGIWTDLPAYEKTLKVPKAELVNGKVGPHPWKSNEPFSSIDLEKMVADGITTHPLLDFQAVSYSNDLVPVTPLRLPPASRGGYDSTRGTMLYYSWVENAPSTFGLEARAGINYTSRGPSKVNLFPIAETAGQSVDEAEIIPDKKPHPFELKTTFNGLHRIQVSDSRAGTDLTWKVGVPMVIEASLTHRPQIFRFWNLYFYVPKGTRTVAGYGDGSTRLLDGTGQLVKTISVRDNYWSVAVPDGQDGKVWKFDNTRGQFILMTVPPYLAHSPQEMLLPREVVEADSINP